MNNLRHSVSDTVVNLDINGPAAAAKMGVATLGTAYGMTDFTLNDAVAALTALYVLLQIGLLMPKYAQLIRAWWAGKKIKVDIHD